MHKGYVRYLPCVCVCVCATMKSATGLSYMSKIRCHSVLYGVFKVFIVWLSLKTLSFKSSGIICGSPLPSTFLTSSRWLEETAMANVTQFIIKGLRYDCRALAFLIQVLLVTDLHHFSFVPRVGRDRQYYKLPWSTLLR